MLSRSECGAAERSASELIGKVRASDDNTRDGSTGSSGSAIPTRRSCAVIAQKAAQYGKRAIVHALKRTARRGRRGAGCVARLQGVDRLAGATALWQRQFGMPPHDEPTRRGRCASCSRGYGLSVALRCCAAAGGSRRRTSASDARSGWSTPRSPPGRINRRRPIRLSSYHLRSLNLSALEAGRRERRRRHRGTPMNVADIRSKFINFSSPSATRVASYAALVPAATIRRCSSSTPGWSSSRTCSSAVDKRAVRARDHVAALRARRRQAQRPRERRLHGAPSHVLRDARQLQLRRLLQARRDPLRVGAADQGTTGCRRTSCGRPSTSTTTRRSTSGRRRSASRPSAASASATTKGAEVRERQLLADGRHRPVRPVLGDLLRPRPRRLRAARRARPTPKATATSRSGTSCSCSSTATTNGVTARRCPSRRVDTGMGLERLAAVLQHVHSNYEIDLFVSADRRRGARDRHDRSRTARRCEVIADHIRACAFLIVDGVIPAARAAATCCGRIIRRAIRHGYQLGQKQPFFHRLVEDLDRADGRRVSRADAATRRASRRC